MNAEFRDLMEIKFRRTIVGSHLQRAAKARFRRVKVALSKFPQCVFKRFSPGLAGLGLVAKTEQFICLRRFLEPFEPEVSCKSRGDFVARAFPGLSCD